MYEKLESSVDFSTGSRFVPLVEHKFTGKCTSGGCRRRCGNCLFGTSQGAHILCMKDIIFVDKQNDVWECINFSNKSRGHKDWFQNLNSDGTPKGGHIDDDYAAKMDRDRKVHKSYPDHLRQKI